MAEPTDNHSGELEERASRYAELFPSADRDGVEVSLAILRTSTVVGRSIGRTIAALDYNLNGPRLQVLRALYLAPDKRLPLKDIAQQMAVNSTNITTIIDVLERDGWVVRLGNEADRRVTYAALTDYGEQRCGVFLPLMLEFMSSLSQGLSEDEKKLLLSLLSQIRARAEASDVRESSD